MSAPDAATVAAVLGEQLWRHAMARPMGERDTWCACLSWRKGRESLVADECDYTTHLTEALLASEPIGQALAALEAVARVEDLVAMWEGWASRRSTPRIDTFRDAATDLRAALQSVADGA